jgi:ribosomal protein L37AE/L43A
MPAYAFPDHGATPTTWAKGQTRRQVEVVCCPDCGGESVQRRGGSEPDSSTAWWECATCRARWKEPSTLVTNRAHAVA